MEGECMRIALGMAVLEQDSGVSVNLKHAPVLPYSRRGTGCGEDGVVETRPPCSARCVALQNQRS